MSAYNGVDNQVDRLRCHTGDLGAGPPLTRVGCTALDWMNLPGIGPRNPDSVFGATRCGRCDACALRS
jgi:hypothetical protein